MFVLKTLRCQQSHTYLKPFINPATRFTRFSLIPPKTSRPISIFPGLGYRRHLGPKCPGRSKKDNRRPLDVVFKEAVGLIEKSEHVDDNFDIDEEGEVLKAKLTELEIELRDLKGKSKAKGLHLDGKIVGRNYKKKEEKKSKDGDVNGGDKTATLSSLFSNNNSTNSKGVEKGFMEERDKLTVKEYASNMLLISKQLLDDDDGSTSKSSSSLFSDNYNNNKDARKRARVEKEKLIVKEYSSDMQGFLKHLYDEGCFNHAQFLTGGKFALSSFESNYARDFVKHAAEKYGGDKQEIAKWLSGSDLKTIALFGCPSCEKRNVIAAKRLRSFFKIPENTVCSSCILKGSCKFVNQRVWNGDTNQLSLAPLMRLLTAYSMEAVPSELVLSDDVKASVSRLLKDVINLSKASP